MAKLRNVVRGVDHRQERLDHWLSSYDSESKGFRIRTVRARLLPGLLTVLPVAATVYAWNPSNPLGWNGLGGLLVGCGSTILLSFIARDLGKAAEERLYEKWGGRPTELAIMYEPCE